MPALDLDRSFYIVLAKGPRGLYIREADLQDSTSLNGAFNTCAQSDWDVERVICFNPVSGSSCDLSREIAVMLGKELTDGDPVAVDPNEITSAQEEFLCAFAPEFFDADEYVSPSSIGRAA